MASQASQRVRRIPSPSTKQGPMKATKSFGLGPSGSRPSGVKKNSPSASPTQQCGGEFHRKRRSPDHRLSPDRAASPVYKGRSLSGTSPVIKRTNSLDNIVGPYLKGEWPREPAYSSQPAIVVTQLVSTLDQDTQTPAEWEELVDRGGKRVVPSSASHKRSHSVGNSGTEQQPGKEKVKGLRLGKSNLLRGKHSPRFRGSTEGINQEIERLSLRQSQYIICPDGHRAPVQELLDHHNTHHYHHHHHHQQHSTRSAITQTPSRAPLTSTVSAPSSTSPVSTPTPPPPASSPAVHHQQQSYYSQHGGGSTLTATSDRMTTPGCDDEDDDEQVTPPCCCSASPLSDAGDSSSAASSRASSAAAKEEKECESPDPKECKFIREPPDGAEKVNLKVIEEDRRNVLSTYPVMPKCPRLIIPSTKSAFLKLYQPPTHFKPITPPPTCCSSNPATPSPTADTTQPQAPHTPPSQSPAATALY